MSKEQADAWVQGFLMAHLNERGEFAPNRTDLEVPWHLEDQMRWWNPYVDESDPDGDE